MTTITRVESDLDGAPDARTILLRFDGDEREVDLTEQQIATVHEALRPVLDASRPWKPTKTKTSPTTTPEWRAAVRGWAHAVGIEQAGRGRLTKEVLAAFGQEEPSIRDWAAAHSRAIEGDSIPPQVIREYTAATHSAA